MRIRDKFILGSVIISVCVVMAGVWGFTLARTALRERIGLNAELFARSNIEKIDRDIYMRIEELRLGSLDPLLQQALVVSNHDFSARSDVQGYIDQCDREWMSVPKETITPFMAQLVNNDLSEGLRRKIAFYVREYGYPLYGELFVTNAYGVNVAQSDKTSDYRQDDELWWQSAQKNGVSVGDVEFDESSGIFSLPIGIRIDNAAGDFLGVMKAVVNIQEINTMIKEANLFTEPDARDVRLINKDGVFIFSSYTAHVLGERMDADYFGQMEHVSGNFIVPRAKAGDSLLSAYARSRGYKSYRGLGWIVNTEYDERVLFQPVAVLGKRILVIAGGVIVLAVLLGFFIIRAILRPLEDLTRVISEINSRGGVLDVRARVHSNDEIGFLASSFNQMVDNVKKTHETLVLYDLQLKQKSQELEKVNTGLEQAIAQRTGELRRANLAMLYMVEDLNRQAKALHDAQERFIRSEKLASLGKMAGIVGHELRNPLGVIRNCLYYVRMKLAVAHIDEKVKQHLQMMEEEVNNAEKVVTNFLSFGRMKPPECVEVAIESILEKAIAKVTIPETIMVIREYGKDVPVLQGDVDQLVLVFNNLIYNAIQAMPQGGRVTLTSVVHDAYIEARIKDNGVGISKENFEKVFEPLFSTRIKGTGLGLVICKSVIENHQGTIEIISSLGEGTEVRVRLPRKCVVKG